MIIEPAAAYAFEALVQEQTPNLGPQPGPGPAPQPNPGPGPGPTPPGPGQIPQAKTPKTRFYGSVDLDPIQARRQFADIADDIIAHLSNRNATRVRIKIDIEADTTDPFDDQIQRIVKENCNQFRFGNAEFEE